jgi:hypothetical protein
LELNTYCGPRTIKTPLEAAASSLANISLGDEDILEGITVISKSERRRNVGEKVVTVFGIDLSEYMQEPSDETPFERFLGDENRLGEMASQPWVGRGCKL